MAISAKMLESCRRNQKKASQALIKWHGPYRKNLAWLFKNMIARCYKPQNSHYRFYGGRGIKVCDFWMKDRRRFYAWAVKNGYKPGVGLSIERKNVNKDYSPSNCCFIQHRLQSRNQTRSRWIEWNGRRMICSDWSRELFRSATTVTQRLHRGWSIERTMTTPERKKPSC